MAQSGGLPQTGQLSRTAPLGLSWPLIVAAILFPLLLRSSLLTDGDSYWHLAVGHWILEKGAVPGVDVFSFTMKGQPWLAHEWLAEVVYAVAHAVGGWGAMVCLAAGTFVGALAILTRYLLRHLEPIYALCLTAAAASMAGQFLLARPHVLAFPVLVYWSVLLVRAVEEGRAPPWGAGLLMVLWANLHGSFPLGLLLAFMFGAEALLGAGSAEERWRLGRQWASFLLIVALAPLATPHGVAAYAFALEVHRMEFTMANIAEWRPPDFHHFQPLELWLLLGAAVTLSRGLRLPLVRLVLLLLLLHLALKHVRHVALLGLLAPVLIAASIGAQWTAGRSATVSHARGLDRLFAALAPAASATGVLLAAAYFGAIVVLVVRLDMIRPPPQNLPVAAVKTALAATPPGPVFNEYSFGGYLIYAGVAPFIDGRADLYGDKFVAEYLNATRVSDLEQLPALLDKYRIGWTLLYPKTAAVALMDRQPGWRRLHTDDLAIVHIRESR